MRRTTTLAAMSFTALLLTTGPLGCGDKDGGDSGSTADGGSSDGGSGDGGSGDGGSGDGGSGEGGAGDGGTDGGSGDGGTDGGSGDGGSGDGGSGDGGSGDGGSGDGGSGDGGSGDGGSGDGGSGDGGSGDGGSGDGGGDGGSGTSIADEGLWRVERGRVTKDPCEFADDKESEKMNLGWVSDVDFQFTGGKKDEVIYACSITGTDFTCDPNLDGDEFGGAVISSTEILSGTFSTETSMTGSVYTNVECEGDGCAEFGADFPCEIEQVVTGTWLSGR